MSATTVPPHVLGALARQEIRNYLRSRLFWLGSALWVFGLWTSVTGSSSEGSTVGDGIFPAGALGVLGIVVMAGMVRNSDRAATAAGAVAVPQRTRTLALAAAVVVPAGMGLIWFACAVIGYQVDPPASYAGPAGSIGEDVVYAQLFTEGVMACIGGPLLGLVIGRWTTNRGVPVVAAVVVVIGTMVLQPLFSWADHVRLAWIWTHFYVPTGIADDPERMVRHPGSPYLYIGYQAALCVLGVMVAMYADPEVDRPALRRRILVVAVVAAAFVALALLVGPQDRIPSPIPSPAAD